MTEKGGRPAQRQQHPLAPQITNLDWVMTVAKILFVADGQKQQQQQQQQQQQPSTLVSMYLFHYGRIAS